MDRIQLFNISAVYHGTYHNISWYLLLFGFGCHAAHKILYGGIGVHIFMFALKKE